jgi:ubiquitin-protein ligase
VFNFKIGPNYPHEAPKVKCETQVYHPNIDLEGNICLNILREDWKPVLTVNSVIYGLQYLFLVGIFYLKLNEKFSNNLFNHFFVFFFFLGAQSRRSAK